MIDPRTIDRMCEAYAESLACRAVKPGTGGLPAGITVWALMPERLKEERRAAMRAAVGVLSGQAIP